jgi:hypothetical protein
MSNLSAALAAALQNDDAIGSLISGVISGRNFDLQDGLLATSPYACISVIDLIMSEQPYFGTRTHGNKIVSGQIEVRCISKVSEANGKSLAELVKTYLWSHRTVPYNGQNLPLGVSNIMHHSGTNEDLTTWEEILTVNYV